MLVLSNAEMDGLRRLGKVKRKRRLKRAFFDEIQASNTNSETLSDFFDKAFDAAISLPELRDGELLNLCRIGYCKRVHVSGTEEFRRCELKQRWPGRALYLCAALETILQNEN